MSFGNTQKDGTGTSYWLVVDNDGRLQVHEFLWNGTAGERRVNNTQVELIADGTYSATQASADQVNYNARGIAIVFDITAVPGTDTVTIRLQMKDAVSGKYITLAEDSAQAGMATRLLIVYPGIGSASGAINVAASFPLPRTWRVQVSHSAASNFDYSVGGSYIL